MIQFHHWYFLCFQLDAPDAATLTAEQVARRLCHQDNKPDVEDVSTCTRLKYPRESLIKDTRCDPITSILQSEIACLLLPPIPRFDEDALQATLEEKLAQQEAGVLFMSPLIQPSVEDVEHANGLEYNDGWGGQEDNDAKNSKRLLLQVSFF